MIHTPLPIALRPLDAALIAQAGEPGEHRRAVAARALATLAETRIWRAGGRGPDAYDWLGFMRRCLGLDDLAPDLDSTEAVEPARAADLFLEWGCVPASPDAARPGDLALLVVGGEAHGGVIVEARPEGGRRMAHFRAGGSTRVAPYDGDRAWRAFASASFRKA